jgi:acetolactate synthase-1/2/3 large subunit
MPVKTSRVVARTLKDAGVKFVFGVPGGEVTDLMEGFRNEGIEFVLTRHESAAAFMASATGTLTGVPGVCMATLGPGATNMVTGVAQAFLDRAPVIAFTGQLPLWKMATNTHQALDLQTLYATITKWRFTLEPKGCAAAIAKALDIATAERPGPVYVEVPSDVGSKECEDGDGEVPGSSRSRGTTRYLPQSCSPEGIVQAARQLASAKRPMLLAGASAMRARATKELVALSEKAGLPVIVSPQGKSVFPESHSYFVGTLEMLATGYLFDLISSSDFLVTVGFDPVELMGTWQDKPGIYIDAVPNLDRYYTASVELVGSVRDVLSSLTSSLAAAPEPKWTPEEVASLRDGLYSRIASRDEAAGGSSSQDAPGRSEPVESTAASSTPAHAGSSGMFAKELFRAMNRVLPRDAIVSCDVGAHKFATGQLWRADAPGSFLITNGLSSMGYGLPSAIAAKLLYPARTTVAVVGDGGLAMYAGEMDTARRLGTAVIIAVCVDNALSLIKMNQQRKGYPAYGSEFSNPDWVKVAAGMGLGTASVDDEQGMEDALREAMRSGGPFLIEARVDPKGYQVR